MKERKPNHWRLVAVSIGVAATLLLTAAPASAHLTRAPVASGAVSAQAADSSVVADAAVSQPKRLLFQEMGGIN